MNIQRITSEMLSRQPDQTSYILNSVIDKVNSGVTSGGGGGGGDITVVQTTGTSTTAVMSQNAVTRELGHKVNSVSGKGLSSNDYTNTDKLKVDNIDNNIEYAISEHNNDASAHPDIQDDISVITSKIPNQATSSNQLADKNFVNSSINSVTAYYITKNAAGDQFSTYAELENATIFYSGGEIRIPTRNDYCIVIEDEEHEDPDTSVAPTSRYIYQNGQWEFQYIINKTALTAAQLAAVNSGITSEKVTKLDGIEAGAQVNVKPDWNASSSASAGILNKPENLVQDANYVHTDNNFTNAEKTKLADITEITLYDTTGHNTDGAIDQNTVTTTFIQSEDPVSTPTIADVSTSRIVEGAVTTSKLANNAVTTGKILMQGIFDAIYPIGAIYMSVNNANPSTLFGGTWVAWGAGKVPVGVNSSETEFNAVEKTGGEKTHTLTTNEMPSHQHKLSLTNYGSDTASGVNWSTNSVAKYAYSGDMIEPVGGGQPHNNLQPYITCYMWKRTA